MDLKDYFWENTIRINKMKHIPVLLNDVLKTIGDGSHPPVQSLAGKTIVDCTFGAGGYTRAFLERGANVIAFDRDPNVITDVEKIAAEFGNKFHFVNKPFSQIGCISTRDDPGQSLFGGEFNGVDAIVFDLGISSMQIDNGERGFSFRFDGPLDMRMGGGITAAELIEQSSVDELSKILRDYGDIKNPRGLAQKIIDNRPQTTFELKDLIGNPRDIAPVFQALRIAVNDEMGQLETAIMAVPELLKPGGMCVAVTFHSLEDRIVKNIFREWTTEPGDPRIPVSAAACDMGLAPCAAPFKLLKTYKPSAAELENNPRARSAHLRAVKKN